MKSDTSIMTVSGVRIWCQLQPRHPTPIFGLYHFGHGSNKWSVLFSGHTRGTTSSQDCWGWHPPTIAGSINIWGCSFVGGIRNSAPSPTLATGQKTLQGRRSYLANMDKWVGGKCSRPCDVTVWRRSKGKARQAWVGAWEGEVCLYHYNKKVLKSSSLRELISPTWTRVLHLGLEIVRWVSSRDGCKIAKEYL